MSNSVAHGWQPIGALHNRTRLESGEQIKIVYLLGYHENPQEDKFDPPGSQILNKRKSHPHLKADEKLPDDTRLWAALQNAGGGTWAGCIYDVDKIIEALNKGTTKISI